jgi:hypothetical protein
MNVYRAAGEPVGVVATASGRGVRLSRILTVLCVMQLVTPSAMPGAAPPSRVVQTRAATPEYEVKAAFLYNLVSFVEWPEGAFAGPDSPLVIGITGPDPFGDHIDRLLTGKRVRGRSLAVRRVEWGAALKDCHVLFVSAGQADRLPELSRLLDGTPVLTVGDEPRSARRGCVMAFVVNDSKVGLEINVDEASRARLVISSKLLSLARIRRGEPAS